MLIVLILLRRKECADCADRAEEEKNLLIVLIVLRRIRICEFEGKSHKDVRTSDGKQII